MSETSNSEIVVKVAIPSAPVFLGESFDYLVPRSLLKNGEIEIESLFGRLVKVNFHGRKKNGFIVEVGSESEFHGKIKEIDSIVSSVPLFSKNMLEVYREIASYFASNVAQILNFAIPARHATAEKQFLKSQLQSKNEENKNAVNENFAVAKNLTVERTVKISHAGVENGIQQTVRDCAEFIKNAVEGERRVLMILPDLNSVAHFQKCVDFLIPDSSAEITYLHSNLQASELFENHLKISFGLAKIIVGTRQAALAPADSLTDIVIVKDYDFNHKERRAPFHNSREISLIRSQKQNADLKIIAPSISLSAVRWLEMKYFTDDSPSKESFHFHSPQIEFLSSSDLASRGEAGVKIPSSIVSQVRKALEKGPVQFVTPFGGYFNLLVCAKCQSVAVCQKCGGSLKSVSQNRPPICSKCVSPAINYSCHFCFGNKLKTTRAGVERLEFEIGKLLPGIQIKLFSNSQENKTTEVDDRKLVAVSTINSVPIAKNGFQMTVILDADKIAFVNSLDGSVDALNKIMEIISMNKSHMHDGKVILMGEFETRFKNAIISYDPLKIVSEELKSRQVNSFPPFSRVAALVTLSKNVGEVCETLKTIGKIKAGEIVGPFDLEETNYSYLLDNWTRKFEKESLSDELNNFVCILIRVPLSRSKQLASALLSCQKAFQSKKLTGELKILLDPKEFL